MVKLVIVSLHCLISQLPEVHQLWEDFTSNKSIIFWNKEIVKLYTVTLILYISNLNLNYISQTKPILLILVMILIKTWYLMVLMITLVNSYINHSKLLNNSKMKLMILLEVRLIIKCRCYLKKSYFLVYSLLRKNTLELYTIILTNLYTILLIVTNKLWFVELISLSSNILN